MPWNTNELQEPKILKRYNRLCAQFRHFILKYQKAQNVFLPFLKGVEIEKIMDIVRGTDINYKIVGLDFTLGEKLLLFKYARQAIVMRFHGVQFALFHRTPFLAISYFPKTSNILTELGLDGRYV